MDCGVLAIAMREAQRRPAMRRLSMEWTCHVDETVVHDHVLAKRLSIRTVPINRRAGDPGGASAARRR